MSIEVIPVGYTDKAMKDFLRAPWAAQAGNPIWCPPLNIVQREVFDPRRGPFHEYGEAQYFLAYKDGAVAGRLTAHINPRHEELHGEGEGFFGFFECVEDQAVADSLFGAAEGWLRSQGKTAILGPLGFAIYDEVGLLIDGFDTIPAILQTYNPPYYQKLVENYGFEKAVDWYGYGGTPTYEIAQGFQERIDKIMRESQFTMRMPTAKELIGRADEARQLFNEAWEPNWGHVPFTTAEFKRILKELKPLLRPELMRAVYDKDDKLVGYLINVPDITPQLQRMNGRLTPWGVARLYWEARFKTPKRVRSLIMGVRREHQGRRLHLALMMSIYLQFLKFNLTNWDCSLIVETNRPTMRAFSFFRAEIYKTWRIYRKAIPPTE